MTDPRPERPRPSIRIRQVAYRAVDPRNGGDPLSGEGAAAEGQRFNPKGMAALYLSLSPLGALRDACKGIERFDPTTLIAAEVDAEPVFDATDGEARRALSVGEEDFAEGAGADGEAPGQRLARRLTLMGYAGMRVKSFAPGAPAEEINLVLWRWTGDGARVSLIDREGRLPEGAKVPDG